VLAALQRYDGEPVIPYCLGTVSECSQPVCGPEPHGGGETLEGFVLRLGAGCAALNLGYVKRLTKYIVHTRATADGWCELRSFPCPTCPCGEIGRNERNVVGIGLGYYDPIYPTWLYSLGPIYPITPEVHEVDSRSAGTTDPPPGGRPFTPFYVGRYAILEKSQIDPTQCSMAPTFVEWSIALKSVECLPTFRLNPNGTINRVPNDGTPVRIVTPFSDPTHPIRIAIEAAAKAWNAVLVSWGENPIFDETAQTTSCTGNQGGRCATVRIQLPPSNPLLCGETIRDNGGDDGIIDFNANIYIPPGYSTNATYLRFLLSHELGHLIGLADAVGCGATSVMSRVAACNSLGNPPTVAAAPQPSDGFPVADTVYGPGSRHICEGAPQ